jgi:hypothetical protein
VACCFHERVEPIFFAKFEFNAVILKKKTHSRPAADVLGDSSEKEKSFL